MTMARRDRFRGARRERRGGLQRLGVDTGMLKSPWLSLAMLYLLACVTLGGSSAGGAIANAILQGMAVLIIAAALVMPRRDRLPGEARTILLIALFTIAIAVIQLIPLPWSIWTQLGGRDTIARALSLLGAGEVAMPISLAPDGTIAAMLAFLPALAAFSLGLRLTQPERRIVLLALIAGVALSSLIGLLQITGAASALYFYTPTNLGRSVGFFANANHQATLLVMTLPLIAASIPASESSRRWWKPHDMASLLLYAATALLIMCAVATLSLAALGLVVVAGVGSAIIFLAGRRAVGRTQSTLLVLAAISCVVLLGVGLYAVRQLGISAEAGASPGTRLDFYANTLNAIRHYGLFGSGLGTFIDVYPAFQPLTQFSRTYVNHAHNDLLEFILETGVAGGIVLIATGAWFVRRGIDALRGGGGEAQIARGALLAIGIVALHSLVDYPIRTAAISGICGLLMALLCRPPVESTPH